MKEYYPNENFAHLPRKHVVGNMKTDVIESRKIMLERFLQEIVTKQQVLDGVIARRFLDLDGILDRKKLDISGPKLSSGGSMLFGSNGSETDYRSSEIITRSMTSFIESDEENLQMERVPTMFHKPVLEVTTPPSKKEKELAKQLEMIKKEAQKIKSLSPFLQPKSSSHGEVEMANFLSTSLDSSNKKDKNITLRLTKKEKKKDVDPLVIHEGDLHKNTTRSLPILNLSKSVNNFIPMNSSRFDLFICFFINNLFLFLLFFIFLIIFLN